MNKSSVISLKLNVPLPLTMHPAAVYIRHLGPGTRPTIRHALNTIASVLTNNECDVDTLNWAALRYQHTAAVQASLLEKYAPSTVKKMISALKRVLEEARKLGLMDAETYKNAIDLPRIRDTSRRLGRGLSAEEISAVMGVCENDFTRHGFRDTALISVLRGTGLRRGELVKLELKDFNPENGALLVRGGKGGKDRTVYLPELAIAYLKDWLTIRGDSPGALLCPIQNGGRIEFRHMTSQAVLLIMRKRAKQAGVERFSPHDFRRTFCSDLLEAGVDIVTVQKLVGHSSPITTAQYDRRGEETKRRAVQKLSF